MFLDWLYCRSAWRDATWRGATGAPGQLVYYNELLDRICHLVCNVNGGMWHDKRIFIQGLIGVELPVARIAAFHSVERYLGTVLILDSLFLGNTYMGVNLMHFLTFFMHFGCFSGGTWDSGESPQDIAGNNTAPILCVGWAYWCSIWHSRPILILKRNLSPQLRAEIMSRDWTMYNNLNRHIQTREDRTTLHDSILDACSNIQNLICSNLPRTRW